MFGRGPDPWPFALGYSMARHILISLIPCIRPSVSHSTRTPLQELTKWLCTGPVLIDHIPRWHVYFNFLFLIDHPPIPSAVHHNMHAPLFVFCVFLSPVLLLSLYFSHACRIYQSLSPTLIRITSLISHIYLFLPCTRRPCSFFWRRICIDSFQPACMDSSSTLCSPFTTSDVASAERGYLDPHPSRSMGHGLFGTGLHTGKFWSCPQ